MQRLLRTWPHAAWLNPVPEEHWGWTTSIQNIVRIMDGPLAPIRCASVTAYQPCEDCPDELRCEIRDIMKDVRIAISGVLDQRTIADLIRGPRLATQTLLDD